MCGFVVDHKRIDALTQYIRTTSKMPLTYVGARAFRCDYEGCCFFYEGGVRDGRTQPTITPLINGPPNEGHLRMRGGGVGGGYY